MDRKTISAFVFGFVMVASALMLPLIGAASGGGKLVYVYKTEGASLLLHQNGVAVLGDYPSYVIASVDQNAISDMKSSGVPYREVSSKIYLLRGTYDTSVPGSIPASMATATGGMSLIQFVGPVEQQWTDNIQLMGVKIYQYIPDYAILADIPASALAKVQSSSYVRWVGSYGAELRTSTALDSVSGTTPVTIMASDWDSARSVAYKLLKAGGGIDYMSENKPSIIRARVDAQQIQTLAGQPGVLWIEPAYEFVPFNANASKTLQNFYGFNNSLWDRGLHGEGQILGISDSGINKNHTAFQQPGKIACYIVMPGAKDGDDSDHSFHGSHTSGTLAGYNPAIPINKGMAYQGSICMADVGAPGGTGLAVPADLRDLYNPMIPYDTKIISNSWGYGYNSQTAGQYLAASYTADAFMWENPETLLVFSAGNADHSKDMKVMAPSTAKSLVAAGGTDNGNMTPRPQENAYVASSAGPTADGRIKPEVTAPANPLYSVDGSKNEGYIGMAGTSMAAPSVTGSLGLIRQYFKEGWYPLGEKRPTVGFNASGSLLKAVAINSADDMNGTDVKNPIPNTVEGWGRMDLENTMFFNGKPRTMKVMDFKDGMSTGEFMDLAYNITSGEVLKITLAWTDYPGSTSAAKQLVNDLDLIVTAPNGTVYYGNNFVNGESKSGGSPDNTNVEEQVLLKAPVSGLYKVRIFGSNAPMGPQPFALVVAGKYDMMQGTVRLDKAAYGEGQTIKITLEDNSFSSSSIQNANVKVTSNTETTPEVIQLSGNYGVLTGSIQTTLVSPAADGKISVSQGDTIKVEYTDVAPVGTSIATAKVDLKTPALTNVHVVGITDSSAVVMWNSSKSATSTVYYGKTPQDVVNQVNKVVVSQLGVLHQVSVINLEAQMLYYFDVESTDRNGHTVLADNAGRHYTFTTMGITDVLLINQGGVSDDSNPVYRYVEKYQAAFKEFGWGVNLMVPELTGVPSLATLQKYKVVLYESGVDRYPPMTQTWADLIKNYNDQGGRLLVSGHDIGWALVKSDSGYYQPWGDNFVKSQLKAKWLSDPGNWKMIKGYAGDPISGDYTKSISYTPFRAGADGEEVSAWSAGGNSTVFWDNDAGLKSSVRWNSSANNGTSGVGYWGGTPSKTVWYGMEICAITDASTRAMILNKTLVWLIGHAAPIIKLTNPTGGKVSGTVTVSWNVTTYGGTNVKNQSLYISNDNGQGWVKLADIAPGTKTYSWDTTMLNNGNMYKIKIWIADDGTPSLSGTDASGTLTIANPNGDKIGPIVVPGSIYIEPNPGKSGNATFFNTTIDDTSTGVSNITGAEVFIDTTGANGTGLLMNASDLAWDSAVEDVFYFGNLSVGLGPHKVFSHGMDEAGNWGPFSNLSIVVNKGYPNYTAAPKVLYNSPQGDNITLTTQVSALFSKTMNWSATKPAFSLKEGGNSVTGSAFGSGNTLTFTPSAKLMYGTIYTAKIDTTAKDENGINLASDFIWTFKTLPYFGWITGKVTDELNVPLPGATVAALNKTGKVNETLSLSDGTFIVGVKPDVYSVNGSKATYLPAQVDNVIVRPGKFTSGVNLKLTLGVGVITGNITCSGKGVAAATLKLWDASGGLAKSGSTPQNGKYAFSGVVMGTYALNASKVGVGEKNVTGIIVEPKKTTYTDVELCVAPSGWVTGEVKDKKTNVSISGASVEAKYDSNGTVAINQTTPDGKFNYTLAPDTYTITAWAPTYIQQAVPGVAVGAGKTSYVGFISLTKSGGGGTGTIKGTVKDQSAAVLAGATVKAVSGTTVTGTTQADGTYSLDVPVGTTYTVTASKAGYTSGSKSNVAVDSTGVDFTLTQIVVKASTPANNSIDIALDASITITFSVPMDAASVISALSLSPAAGNLDAAWDATNTTLTLTHNEKFKENTAYTLTIAKAAKDKDSNAMGSDYTLKFTTVIGGGGGTTPSDLTVPLIAVIAIVVVALVLFAVLKMRKKPAGGEEAKPEEKKEDEKKEEEKKEGEAKSEEPKPETPTEEKKPEAETQLRP